MMELREQLGALHAVGMVRDIDYYLADTLARCYGDPDPAVLLAVVLASRRIADGHICLDLASIAGRSWHEVVRAQTDSTAVCPENLVLPALDAWLAALKASPLCGQTGDDARPLILTQADGNRPRLYLRRYFQYEQRVARKLLQLASPLPTPAVGRRLWLALQACFPHTEDGAHLNQRAAAQAALERRLLIIAGGPGTGKTHTLARLLVLLTGQDAGPPPVIRMAAPTGKAAMRMRESIREAKKQMALDDARASLIPEDACTLHRLLGAIPRSPHFRHDAAHPLPADLVIIDEASMIALPLMAKLLDALGDKTRLIMLGDHRQLASVEPGAVLGDICEASRRASGTAFGDVLVELTHSRRFDPQGPIGQVSRALEAAGGAADPDGSRAWALVQALGTAPPADGVQFVACETPESLWDPGGAPIQPLRKMLYARYRAFLGASGVGDAFAALRQFRLLCAMRHGPHGVFALNRIVEQVLAGRDPSENVSSGPARPNRRLNPSGLFYDHRLIIITRNDYTLGLFNGDIGIILPASAAQDGENPSGRLVAWFETGGREGKTDGFRAVPCHMLPEHETAFALTIHKAQGSQFRDVLIMLPPQDNPVLTRELLYTGLTRCEQSAWLWCPEAVFKQAAVRATQRASGLSEALRFNE